MEEQLKILINATAAKFGGARTIVESYLQWIAENDSENEYHVFVGFDCSQFQCHNIHYYKKETGGFKSFLYSTIGILINVLKIKPDILFSFNNVNLAIPCVKRVTYFHQLKVFDKRFDKTFLYRFVIKWFLKKTSFIVQSNFVRDSFISLFECDYNVKVMWPGFLVPGKSSFDITFINEIKKFKENSKTLLFPVSDVQAWHKNFKFLTKNKHLFKKNNIQIIVTSDDGKSDDVFTYIGKQSYDHMFALYEKVDGLIFVSLLETLGLPIFEFATTGKPVFVLKQGYIEDLYNKFEKPLNIVLFEEDSMFSALNCDFSKYTVEKSMKYSESEWNGILKGIT